jgi:hypothetical protein
LTYFFFVVVFFNKLDCAREEFAIVDKKSTEMKNRQAEVNI